MILVTGATGLLGSHLIRQLLERGEKPRAIARKVSRRSFLAQPEAAGAELKSVDLAQGFDPADLLDHVDTVIHSAALASPFPQDFDKMRQINVLATQRLFEAALEAGVKNWVQISSIASFSGGNPARLISESAPALPRPTGYAASKHEIDAWLEGHTGRMRIAWIHPCYMLDEWDARPSSGAILFALKMGRITGFIDGIKNFVAARDVASATLAAIEREAAGHYLVGGENVQIRDFFSIACQELGLPSDTLRLFDDFAEVPDPVIHEFCRGSGVDCSKARRELAYIPTLDLRTMIRAAIGYFQRFRMLRVG